jgi:hypothetical protein
MGLWFFRLQSCGVNNSDSYIGWRDLSQWWVFSYFSLVFGRCKGDA